MILLGVLVLIASALAADPDKCCIDREFEAYLDEAGSYVSAQDKKFHPLQGYTTVAYDYYAKKMVLKVHNTFDNGTETSGRLIFDYEKKLEYAIYNKQCTIHKYPLPMRVPCVPDNATYDGPIKMGYGAHTIDLHSWRFKQPVTNHQVKLAVSVEGCVPVIESIYINTPKLKEEIIYIITNFHAGIKHRSVFNIPHMCDGKPIMDNVQGIVG